jgi:peptide/nickel transport system permease protein
MTVAGELVAGRPAAPTRAPRFSSRLLHRPLAIVCLAYLALIVGIAIVAPIVMPGVANEHAGDLLEARQGPSWDHLLGTDALGRDVLDRLLVGTRVTLVGVAEALIVVLVLGIVPGIAAGYLRGKTERAVVWLADLTFSVPSIIVILVVLAVFPQSMFAAMVTLGLLTAPALMRVVRSATLPVREELYVSAAQVSGLSRRYIMGRHILPRVAGPIIVQVSLLAAVALLTQTGLSFLNLIVAAPAPSWGGLVADGVTSIVLQPWLIWPPGIAIALTILVLGLLGDEVRDTSTEAWSAAPQTTRSRRRRTLRPVPAPTGAAPAAAAGDSLLEIEGLSVTLPSPSGPVDVLRDVTFDVRRGEVVGLVGESGCGKTMTAMSILGLLPAGAQIAAGRIEFADRDLAALSERELGRVRGRRIGLVSQEPMVSLDPVFRVGNQLAESLRRHRGLSRRAANAAVLDLLRRVRLPDAEGVARRYPYELSGGMAQRVAIARALAGDPDLLIADEPTTALDVTVQEEILSLLRDLRRERNLAILFVTHDWGVVADICDRIVVMYAGEVVERADAIPLFRRPLHPYTRALLASNPHSAPAARLLPTIPGTVPRPGSWPAGCHFHDRCPLATDACRARPVALAQPDPSRETRCLRWEELAS